MLFLFFYSVKSAQIALEGQFSNLFTLTSNYNPILVYGNSSLKIESYGEYIIEPKVSFTAFLYMWGAGGGSMGGKGGFSYGSLDFSPNVKYVIWIGEGGRDSLSGLPGTFGGGGLVGKANAIIGTGGGLTGLFLNDALHENSIIIAGGGGGGKYEGGYQEGGAGGGINGTQGIMHGYLTYSHYAGCGGTQTKGGTMGYGGYGNGYGSANGEKLKGGNGASSITTMYSGASGGGGYYGGGSGNNNNYAGGPGGGGSGFIHPDLVHYGYTSFHTNHTFNNNGAGLATKNGLFVLTFSDSPTYFRAKTTIMFSLLLSQFIAF